MPPMPVPTNEGTRQRDQQKNRRDQQMSSENSRTQPSSIQPQAQQQQQQPVKMDNNLNILFNQSKDEMFSLTQGYKKFQRELKNFKISTNRDDITLEKLSSNRIFVTIAPQKKFSSAEIDSLKRYVSLQNGSLLILLSEGGESKLNTNINFLLEEFGVFVNNDAIVRTTYYKYFNPKEAF